MQMDYSSCFTFLDRTFDMGYGDKNFMGVSTKHLLSNGIFPDFIRLYRRGDKKNKFSKPLTKINSTESHTRYRVLKFLPEPKNVLRMLQ